MLTSLSVQNYALIQNLEINFNKGFSIITGETGAGKSILLGALGLILGQRADTNMLKNKKEKCKIYILFMYIWYVNCFHFNEIIIKMALPMQTR